MKEAYEVSVNCWVPEREYICVSLADAEELAMSLYDESAYYEFLYLSNYWGDEIESSMWAALCSVQIYIRKLNVY